MIPKAFYFFIWLMAISVWFFSCSKSDDVVISEDSNDSVIDDENDTEDEGDENGDNNDPDQETSLVITVSGFSNYDTSEMEMAHEKDASLIIVHSDLEWNASANAEWITLADYSGESGSKGVLVGVSKNKFVPRTGEITVQAGNNKHIIYISQQGAPEIFFTAGDVEFKMILVEGGDFMMGDSDLTDSRWAHRVSVNSFYMCETEVTNALWNQVMGSLPYDNLEGYEDHDEYNKPNHPVSAVSWNEINELFLPAISELTGFEMRLPTEAEWEYAAMGGKYSKEYIYSGSDILDEVAWHSYNSSNSKQPVAQLKPNELGLYDMSGNVSEWCSDWFKSGYDINETDNPTGPETGTEKVIRGGNYWDRVMFGKGVFYVKMRLQRIPDCFVGCWGDSGLPDEPICFICDRIGFRFVMAF